MISKQTRIAPRYCNTSFSPFPPVVSFASHLLPNPIISPLNGCLATTFALHYRSQWHPNPLPLPARPPLGPASTGTTSKAPAKTIEGSKAAKKTLEIVAVAAAADDSRKTQMCKDSFHTCSLRTLRYHRREGLRRMVCPTPPTRRAPPVYPQAAPKAHRQHCPHRPPQATQCPAPASSRRQPRP
jgi:hypothetical protein